MTNPLWLILATLAFALYLVFLLRPRNLRSDDDHYALVQKYSDAASALTATKAELDKLQEQLEFSEDVRYTLGMENAKLVKRIIELEIDVERGEETRFLMVGMLDNEINARIAFGNRLMGVQRSLRIARHKEFKRWKKMSKRRLSEYRDPTPATYHYAIGTARRSYANSRKDWSAKDRMREYIDKLRTMDPYPLP